MQVYTNATKRDPQHTIDVNPVHIIDFVIPKFRNMPKKWKIIDARHMLPGLKLHYKIWPDGINRVSFEEAHNGVANFEHWYTEDQLTDNLPF